MEQTYQLWGPLPTPIEDALRVSIQRFGVLVPIVKDQHGNVLDGHHRMRLADALSVSYRVDVVQVLDEANAKEIARTLNADRRQLTEDQRREVAVALRQEGHSLRAIAGALGVHNTTIMRDVEKAGEKSGAAHAAPEIPSRITGTDGKSYQSKKREVLTSPLGVPMNLQPVPKEEPENTVPVSKPLKPKRVVTAASLHPPDEAIKTLKYYWPKATQEQQEEFLHWITTEESQHEKPIILEYSTGLRCTTPHGL